MKIETWLRQATHRLLESGIGSARLDCLILLEDALQKDRSWLLAHPEATVQGRSLYRLEGQIKQRVKHEPLAYIRGKTEFYGRTFFINKDVLEPRPESETMIDLLKQIVAGRRSPVASSKTEDKRQETSDHDLTVVDVGTGSGALAITAQLELPEAKVLATDIDPKCLKIAKRNAKTLDAKIEFYQGDLMQPLLMTGDWRLATGKFVLLANLPYVPDSYQLNQAAANEPRTAIFGGPDGLDLYRRMFKQLNRNAPIFSYIFTESLPFQHAELSDIAKGNNYKLTASSDLIQVFQEK